MEFRILGPVQVLDDGELVPVPAGRVRTLLAVLLLRANHVSTVEELIDQLWELSPPDNPRAALQTCVGRLRQALGQPLVHTRPHGYLIELDPAHLDLSRFRGLVHQAARAAGPVERAQLLSNALDLWRGPPLADLGSEYLAREATPRLVEERLHAQEQLIDARLELGQHAQVVAQLTGLTGDHPLRERFWAQLMFALYRCGRQADALQAYRSVSDLLADQLGIDPGEDLQRVHQWVLTADPQLAPASRAETVPAEPSWIAQWQLPLDVGDFVGRQDRIDELEALLTADSAVPVVTVSGPPGVGKTALAVRVAHRLRPAFPDGQWYVRLDGAGSSPRDAGDVLAELLRTSGVDGAALPETLDARAAMLRARLADRRVLLLLDNAGSAEQVRPLLPGAAGSAVLVTSRPELTGLIVFEGGRGIRLDGLDPHEASALLVHILGASAIHADPGAAAELVKLCGYLPLALRIVAANLAGQPGKSITNYVAELRSDNRLGKLAVIGDPRIAVRTAFDLSYAGLDPAPQRLFRLLGLIPGPDFTAAAAAALIDTTSDHAEHLLDRLATANLVQRHASDRYLFHDLLRLYAAEVAQDDPLDSEPAWNRLCEWCLATADAAVQFEYLPLVRLPGRPPAAGKPFDGADQARDWLDAERASLAAAAVRAADAGPPRFAWLLPNTLVLYLYVGRRLPEWRAAVEAGLGAAQAAGNRPAEGSMRHILGGLYGALGDMRSALEHERIALQCYREAGLRTGEAALLGNMADSYDELGQPRQAVNLLDEGIALFHAIGRPHDGDMALAVLSRAHLHLGELGDAIRRATDCLAIGRASRGARWRALVIRGAAYRLIGEYEKASADLDAAMPILGDNSPAYHECEMALLHADTGKFELAFRHATNALWASRQPSHLWSEACALNVLGEVHRLRGQPDDAAAHHTDALRIATAKGYQATAAEAHLGLAWARYGEGEPAAARSHAEQALLAARKLELRITECRTLLVLTAISGHLGEPGDASRHAAQARRIKDETGYRPPARTFAVTTA